MNNTIAHDEWRGMHDLSSIYENKNKINIYTPHDAQIKILKLIFSALKLYFFRKHCLSVVNNFFVL